MTFSFDFEQQKLVTSRFTQEPITESHAKELCEFFIDKVTK